MMKEIFNRGPIACSLDEDDLIDDYTDFNEIIEKPD
jgi:hypothetical protein